MSLSDPMPSTHTGSPTPKEKTRSLPSRVSPVHHGAGEQGRVYFIEEVIRSTVLYDLLVVLRDAQLPDAWLASGAIYQTIWNALTGKDPDHGIKDYDLIYHDEADTSYEAEDRVITQLTKACEPLGLPVEIRNQARVHLWFPKHFGIDYPKLGCSLESLLYYASTTHSVAARLHDDDRLQIEAPFGLEPIFQMQMLPNKVLPNKETFTRKANRLVKNWPELTVVPW
ncbi:nucleotidyltransferase family protein [Pseudovibrio japonicus]|uniref:nucleotidyltransferase family protein n=1 Tax=Pseudovibrio japonicus TaxID=366534 RepID=UPI00167C2EA7|nr:nucleotidyltransferase family protein [Pseudovibrio japonicus]